MVAASFSEFQYLFKWLQKSLPYILMLGVKLVMQHITEFLGIGLLTTFIYANKSIVNQVFLRERCSKIQCAWLLVFLAGSSVLLYYNFSFSVTLLLLNFLKSCFGLFKLLGILGCWNYRLHSEIPLHGFKMPYFIGAFFHHAF